MLKWSLRDIKVKPGIADLYFNFFTALQKLVFCLMSSSDHFPKNFIPFSYESKYSLCGKITAKVGKGSAKAGKASEEVGKPFVKAGKRSAEAGKGSAELGKKSAKPGKRSMEAGKTSEEFGKTSEIDGKGLIM